MSGKAVFKKQNKRSEVFESCRRHIRHPLREPMRTEHSKANDRVRGKIVTHGPKAGSYTDALGCVFPRFCKAGQAVAHQRGGFVVSFRLKPEAMSKRHYPALRKLHSKLVPLPKGRLTRTWSKLTLLCASSLTPLLPSLFVLGKKLLEVPLQLAGERKQNLGIEEK